MKREIHSLIVSIQCTVAYLADFTLRYALRATQDEIGREKRILSSGSLREPRIEGRFSRLPEQLPRFTLHSSRFTSHQPEVFYETGTF